MALQDTITSIGCIARDSVQHTGTDLMFLSGTTLLDKSGVYTVSSTEFNPVYIKINLDSYDLTPIGVPRVYIYKGVKLEILRVDESPTSTLSDRYLIQKNP